MELLRTMLFVPGNRSRMIEKATSLDPDAVIFDIEDAVPPAEKPTARGMIREAMDSGRFDRFGRFVRVNSVSTGLLAADLKAVVGPHMDGIVLPKVESREDVEEAHRLLAECEKEQGLEIGKLRIVPIVETVRGVLGLPGFAGCNPRLAGLCYGAEDFSTDLGVERSREGTEGFYPKVQVALYARVTNVVALDSIFADVKDDEGLEKDTLLAKQLGFKGKLVIHPSQIPIVNSIFTPSEQEIERARKIVMAYDEAEARGEASVTVDGKMVDIPIADRARSLLAVAERISRRR